MPQSTFEYEPFCDDLGPERRSRPVGLTAESRRTSGS